MMINWFIGLGPQHGRLHYFQQNQIWQWKQNQQGWTPETRKMLMKLLRHQPLLMKKSSFEGIILFLYYLDKLVSVSAEVFSSSGPKLGVATGHSSPLHPHPGHDVPLQHLDQLSLVPHQLVQTVHWNLKHQSLRNKEKKLLLYRQVHQLSKNVLIAFKAKWSGGHFLLAVFKVKF